MSWKDWIFEDDPNAAPASKPASKGEPIPSSRPAVSASFDAQPGGEPSRSATTFSAASINDQAYIRLADKTSFENTFAYKQLESFLEPLMGIIADPNLRFKAAFAQAKNGGLSQEKF